MNDTLGANSDKLSCLECVSRLHMGVSTSKEDRPTLLLKAGEKKSPSVFPYVFFEKEIIYWKCAENIWMILGKCPVKGSEKYLHLASW